MAQSISRKMFVMVGANSAALKKALGEAGHHVHDFAHHAREGFSFVKDHALELAAGILGVGLSVEHLKQVAENIDKLAKTADRLNITTEALGGLRHGAELAGMGFDDFDGSLTTMVKNVGLAEAGLGRARKAFEFLGIDAKKLGTLTPENQFKVLAEYISKVEDPTKRLTAAMQIFGDQGAKMINVVEGGAAGVEKMQRRFADLNGEMSRVSAAKVEMMNDSLSESRRVINAIVEKLVVELAPAIWGLSEMFIAWAKEMKSWRDVFVDAVSMAAHVIGVLGDAMQYLILTWKTLGFWAVKVCQAVTFEVAQIVNAIVGLHGKMLGISRVFAQWVGSFSKIAGTLLNLGNAEFKALVGWEGPMADGLQIMRDDLASVAAEFKADMGSIMDGVWPSEKVDRALNQFRRDMDKAAEDMAKDKAKPVPFNSQMVQDVKAAEKLLDLSEKIRQVNFSPNTLLRAGTAQAQAQPFEARWEAMQQQLKRQIDLQNKQLDELKKIDKNTLPQAPDEADVIYA